MKKKSRFVGRAIMSVALATLFFAVIFPARTSAFVTHQRASVVLGQPDYTSWSENNGGLSAKTMKTPFSTFICGTKLFVVDKNNNRVLIYNTIPSSDFAAADVVIGQPDMTSNSENQGGSVGANTLNQPTSVFCDGTKLFIADYYNGRVLIFNSIPTANNASADVVIGQPDMTSSESGISASRFNSPFNVFSDGSKLYISDHHAHRVLIYNTIPTINGAAADVVLGQPDMVSDTMNNGGISANSLNGPGSVYSDGTKLYVTDIYNNRVLIYNSIPASNFAAADVAIGQPNMTSNTANNGGISAATLYYPNSAIPDNGKLYISDTRNNRVLIYNSIPTSNHESANIVIGQTDMTQSAYTCQADSLAWPYYAYVAGPRIAVADYGCNRVVIFEDDTLPPVQSAHNPADSSTTATAVAVTFTTDEKASCRWSLTDQGYGDIDSSQTCAGEYTVSQSCTVSGLTEGVSNVVYLACADAAGNANTAGTNTELTYTVDSPPTQSGWSPASGSTISSSSQIVTFTTDENADCRWSLADQAYGDMTGDCSGDGTTSISCEITGLADGARTVYLSCRDAALNADTVVTNSELSYTVDTTPPAQSSWAPTIGPTTSASITFTTNENADCKWSLSDQAYAGMAGDCTGDGTTSQSCSVSGLVGGTNTVYFACRDLLGNADTASSNTPLVYTVDTNPPTQSGHNPANGSTFKQTSKTVNFATNKAADCKWSFSDQAYADMAGDCTGDGTTSQSCSVSGLVGGTNTVYFACADTEGNADTADTNTGITYTVDTFPPVQSGHTPVIGSSTSPTISFSTDENARCRWSLQDKSLTQMTSAYCAGIGTTSQSCTVSGLVEGPNTIYFACMDLTAPPMIDTADTNTAFVYTVDLTPPVQSAWSPASGTVVVTTAPTVTFTTNENADCKWSLSDQAYADMAGDCSGDGTTSQSCAVSGLAAGEDQKVYFACADLYGNSDSAGTNTELSYDIIPDSTPPVQSAWNPANGAVIVSIAPTITFTTNENADCKWSLSDLAYADMAGDCTGDGTTSQSCAASGLEENTNSVYLACRDSYGNADTAASNTLLSLTYASGLCADIDGDGRIRSKDLLLLKQHIAGTIATTLTSSQLARADVNNDGAVNSADIPILADTVTGKTEQSSLSCPANP